LLYGELFLAGRLLERLLFRDHFLILRIIPVERLLSKDQFFDSRIILYRKIA